MGLENYTRLLQDPDYYNTLWVSLVFTFGTVPVGIAVAVLLAIALSFPG